MSETPSVEVETLLSALKPLADAGALTGGDVAAVAERNVTLLMRAAAEADARSRAALGSEEFDRWSAVAVACTQAIAASVRLDFPNR